MHWTELTEIAQINAIDTVSHNEAVLIFKHSTRCIISSMVLNRLEREWHAEPDAPRSFYILDLLRHRAISNALESHYDVEHASPQVLVIRNGSCVYHSSHTAITYDDVMDEMRQTG